MRRRNVKNAPARIANHPELVIFHPEDHKGKWGELFGNTHPIYLEIGMGKGKFLLEHAMTHPEINYLGLEKFESVIVQAVEKIAPYQLKNIKLLNVDAEKLEEYFDTKELSKIFLNFSDPWPKNRHIKRRLTYASFLEKYDSILDGTIEMKTDNRGLFEFSLLSFNQNKWDFLKLSLDLHQDNYNEKIITTEYEDRFTEKGNHIFFIEIKKSQEKEGV